MSRQTTLSRLTST